MKEEKQTQVNNRPTACPTLYWLQLISVWLFYCFDCNVALRAKIYIQSRIHFHGDNTKWINVPPIHFQLHMHTVISACTLNLPYFSVQQRKANYWLLITVDKSVNYIVTFHTCFMGRAGSPMSMFCVFFLIWSIWCNTQCICITLCFLQDILTRPQSTFKENAYMSAF